MASCSVSHSPSLECVTAPFKLRDSALKQEQVEEKRRGRGEGCCEKCEEGEGKDSDSPLLSRSAQLIEQLRRRWLN